MTLPDILKNINDFTQNGITVLHKLTLLELREIIAYADHVYYNNIDVLMTDNEYDIIREYISNTFPTIVKVGAGVPTGKNKVRLPYEMWSMNKIKPDTNALSSWACKHAGPYVISCKLDGVSGLYTTEGPVPKLYTRGDGKVGQDISHLLSVLKLPQTKGIVVRGEFIIPRQTFDQKYATSFANARNLTSGIINSKTTDDKLADVKFVAYECIDPALKPSKQFVKLKDLGFEVVDYRLSENVTNDFLSNLLIDKRTSCKYEIDGIIVIDDNIYKRISGNPDHAFAFKMVLSDQKAEAKVVDVLWEPSKDGYLKPRVRIEPVHLCGVTITYATGYNAKFIQDNKIGVGAIIEIIRSGDVIPKIVNVAVPAAKTKMPVEEYVWNDSLVDIILKSIDENAIVREKNIVVFFTELEVDGLKSGNIKKIMEAGFDTIPKIIAMTKTDFERVGYKTTAEKYVANIKQRLDDAQIVSFMVASGTMGRGIGARKIAPILSMFPNILTDTESIETKITKIKAVNGIEQKTAATFVENIPRFVSFLSEIGYSHKLQMKQQQHLNQSIVQHPLNGKKIVMTKIRDKEIIDSLNKYGAELDDDIKKSTFVLIVKSKDDVSNKTKFAVLNSIPIMTPEEFKTKFF